MAAVAEQIPDVNRVMEELKEMREWRLKVMEYITGRGQTAGTSVEAVQQDEEMQDNENDDSVEFGWGHLLKGAQAKATQPGAASMVSLLAIPPSGPDSKAGKGGNTISRGPTDSCSKAAQSGS